METRPHAIELVDSCHRHIRDHCRLVERLADHLGWRGADAEAADVARIVVRFFDTTAALHHLDEEIDLFVAVEHYVPSRELNATRALVFRLREDHRRIAAAWRELRPMLAAMSEGAASGPTAEAARRFNALQTDHMHLEETQLLPLARRVLDDGILERLAGSMTRRRSAMREAAA